MDSVKLRRLAGIPVDLSKPENASATVRKTEKPSSSFAPATLTEAAKVPQHRGELAPKTKDNMKARVKHMQTALDSLTAARDALMDVPAVDYMEDIPTIIKQLHQMLHGDDGTGGVHHLHRHYKNEFDNTVFPEDVEEQKHKEEEEAMAAEAGVTESAKVGFEKQVKGPSVEKKNTRPFKLAPGSDEKTMYQDKKDMKAVETSARDAKGEHVTEADDKKPEWLLKAELKAEKKEGKKAGVKSEEEEKKIAHKHNHPEGGAVEPVDDAHGEDPEQDEWAIKDHNGDSVNEAKIKSEVKKAATGVANKELKKNPFEQEEDTDEEDCSDMVPMKEASGPLFARDAGHPKSDVEQERYPSWSANMKPVNVVSDEEPSIYYPNGAKNESPNQLATNPYNENQKVKVPAKIKDALKEQAAEARKLAETFNMRKDWDSKNFHENLADAFETLVNFLNKETVYGIKEAQVFFTTLMGPMQNKIPSDVVKYIAAGGTLRSLKNYMIDVKEPVTGTVYQQDSNGLE